MRRSAVCFLLFLISITTAQASSLPDSLFNSVLGFIYAKDGRKLSDGRASSPEVNWRLASAKDGEPFNSTGVLVNAKNEPFCSATLLDVGADDNTPAYALTAGHCLKGSTINILTPKDVFTNLPTNIIFRLRNFADAEGRYVEVAARRFVYVTMKNIDVAVVELKQTMLALKLQGFRGVPLSREPAAVGDKLILIGSPLSGMRPEQQFTHEALCSVRGIFDSVQDLSQNDEPILYRINHCILHECSAVAGISGGAMLSVESGKIVGTLTWIGLFAKREEVLPDDFTRQFDQFNGASPIFPLAACFNAHGIFDLNAHDCLLESPRKTGQTSACAAKRCQETGRSCFDAASAQTTTDRAMAYAEKGCASGEGLSCNFAGNNFSPLGGRTDSPEKAAKYFARGCAEGALESCASLAWLLETGTGVELSPAKATLLYERACVFGPSLTCYKAAVAYQAGSFVPQNLVKAAQYYAKGCVNGFSEACLSLGEMYEKGDGVQPSVEAASRIYFKACTDRSAEACYKLGILFRENSKNSDAMSISLDFFRRACRYGMKQACTTLNR